MNFSDVTSITIPEGNVKSISVNGTEIWSAESYIEVDVSGEGIVSAPSGSVSAKLKKLLGKSVVWNQMIPNYQTNPEVWQFVGANYEISGDIITLIADESRTDYFYYSKNVPILETAIPNHKYYLFSNVNPEANCQMRLRFFAGTVDKVFSATKGWQRVDVIFNNTIEISSFHTAYITVLDCHECSSFQTTGVFAIDLTKMFGAGNEPTIEECRQIFTDDYYPYSAGELKSVEVTKFTVGSTDYALTFSGKSAGTVRDEIDYVNKKYIQRVGVVDLGTLNFSQITSEGQILFVCTALNDTTRKRNTLCALYTPRIYGVSEDKYYYFNSANTVFVDSTYTSASEFKSAMNGVMFYYELPEPIITDITDEMIKFAISSGESATTDSAIPVGLNVGFKVREDE